MSLKKRDKSKPYRMRRRGSGRGRDVREHEKNERADCSSFGKNKIKLCEVTNLMDIVYTVNIGNKMATWSSL